MSIESVQAGARFLARRVGRKWQFVDRISKDLEITWARSPAFAGAFFGDEHVAALAKFFGLYVLNLKQALDAAGVDAQADDNLKR